MTLAKITKGDETLRHEQRGEPIIDESRLKRPLTAERVIDKQESAQVGQFVKRERDAATELVV